MQKKKTENKMLHQPLKQNKTKQNKFYRNEK